MRVLLPVLRDIAGFLPALSLPANALSYSKLPF